MVRLTISVCLPLFVRVYLSVCPFLHWQGHLLNLSVCPGNCLYVCPSVITSKQPHTLLYLIMIILLVYETYQFTQCKNQPLCIDVTPTYLIVSHNCSTFFLSATVILLYNNIDQSPTPCSVPAGKVSVL